MLYAVFVFTKTGECVYAQKWNADRQRQPKAKNAAKALEHEKKNLFGLLFSMKQFANSVAPRT